MAKDDPRFSTPKLYTRSSMAARPRHQAQEAASHLSHPVQEEGIAEAIQHTKETLPFQVSYESPFQVEMLGDPIDVEIALKNMGWKQVMSGRGMGTRGIRNLYEHWGHEGVALSHSYTKAPLFTEPLKSEMKSVLSFTQAGTGSGY